MNFEAALVQTALTGTQKPHVFAPGEDSALGVLCDQISQETTPPALKLLRLAAALSLGARCGFMPTQFAVQARAQASGPPAAAHSPVLLTVFSEGPYRLQAELLGHLRVAGLCLPSQSLIAALTMGQHGTEIRERLIPVLGTRGRWLASQNKVWSYALGTQQTGEVTDLWSHGTLSERVSWLRIERQRDPVAAREVLARALGDLAPAERAALVAVLDVGLGHDDEAFLNLCLKDRGQEVRLVAARLLCKLPESAFSARMAARLDALLVPVGAGWSIDAPEPKDADAFWKADQIETVKPAGERMGERAWLLAQLVSRMHPSWWVTRLRRPTDALLQWAASSPWKIALHEGWLRASADHAASEWSVALLAHANALQAARYRDRLLAALGLAQVEARWNSTPTGLSVLPDNAFPEDVSHFMEMASELLGACPAGKMLSRDFSLRIAHKLTTIAVAPKNMNGLYALPALELGAIVHLDALKLLCTLSPQNPWAIGMTGQWQALYERRLALDEFIRQNPGSI